MSWSLWVWIDLYNSGNGWNSFLDGRGLEYNISFTRVVKRINLLSTNTEGNVNRGWNGHGGLLLVARGDGTDNRNFRCTPRLFGRSSANLIVTQLGSGFFLWKGKNKMIELLWISLTIVHSPFFTCVLICRIRSSERAKPRWHSGHVYGFSFVWHRVCVRRWSFRVNRRGQYVQPTNSEYSNTSNYIVITFRS